MLNLIFAASLLVISPGPGPNQAGGSGPLEGPKTSEDTPPVSEAARAEEAVTALEYAFKKGKAADRLEAIKKHGTVNDSDAIRWIARGLKIKEPAVCSASIEALRHLKHPDALVALHNSLVKARAIRKNDEHHEAVIRAIGQHGNPKSIKILTRHAQASTTKEVQTARIYSLGNIRDNASIEALLELMQRSGRGGKRGGGRQPLMGEFRIALNMLTGEDLGKEEKPWLDWWKTHSSRFKITEEPTGVSKKTMARWKKYWSVDGPEEEKERRGKRREREDEEKL